MTESGERGRDLSGLVVCRTGRLECTGDEREPYRLVGADGRVAEPVMVFLRDLRAAGKSVAALRRRTTPARLQLVQEPRHRGDHATTRINEPIRLPDHIRLDHRAEAVHHQRDQVTLPHVSRSHGRDDSHPVSLTRL